MKYILFVALLASIQPAFSQHFPLPSGTTYRAFATHFDCGVFGEVKAETPDVLSNLNTKFTYLAADKRINDFLIELNTMQDDQVACYYGVYLKRSREDKTLYYQDSVIESAVKSFDCASVKVELDSLLHALPYEGSRRGLRYLGATINSINSITCADGPTRVIFDRRYTPSK